MADSASISKVREFYAGKNIFITGGTGFLGLALIEKILRDIPSVGNLYLLMRPKKNKTIEERLKDLTKNTIFDVLKTQTESSSDIFKKLIPIAGDVGEEDLGISTDDRNVLINNVNVIIHSAATLDFQQSLKTTVAINLLGTRRVMELCKQVKNIEAMVHVSSAYASSFKLETEEILYDAPGDAEKIIELATTLSEKQLEEIEKEVLKDHPNTYTFTKHFAELEVNKCADRIPCGIVRPSMITAAWKEPVPGWTNSKNGPQGFFMGASRGVVRRLPIGTGLVYDYIPIDIVINQVLVTGQYVNSLKREAGTPLQISVFHCTSSSYRPFRWEPIKDKVNVMMHRYPLKSAVWYPNLKFVQNLFLFKISAIFIHFLPGIILDTVTRLCGGRPILVRLHTNVWKSLNLLEKFIFTEWHFDNKKTLALAKSMTQTDKDHFGIDIGEMKWEPYFETMIQGVRTYLSNEHPKSLEAARKKDKVLLFLHVCLQLFIYFLIWWATAAIFGSTFSKTGFVVPIAYVLLGLL